MLYLRTWYNSQVPELKIPFIFAIEELIFNNNLKKKKNIEDRPTVSCEVC